MRKIEIDNPRYPHAIRIIRKKAGDWLDDPSQEEDVVIYEGCGRSYTDTTTTGNAKVDLNKRKASIPVRYNEWPAAFEDGTPRFPASGDILYVTKGDITEEWEVKDFEPDNNRSVVYGELNRNINV